MKDVANLLFIEGQSGTIQRLEKLCEWLQSDGESPFQGEIPPAQRRG